MPQPDPLKPGHIHGQNPATPERLAGATAAVQSNPRGNEEELGGRPAFLFASGDLAGVTLDSSGANLPRQEARWILRRYFTLGVRDPGLDGVNPETIIRGILARGYHIWRTSDPSRMQGTSQ